MLEESRTEKKPYRKSIKKRSKLIMENIKFEINKVLVTSNTNLVASGLCCVSLDTPCSVFSLFFSKSHLYAANNVTVDGTVYFDGKTLPAAKFHHLLNQFVVFEGKDTVADALSLVNGCETERLMKSLGIYFANKQIARLSVQESRIFEVAVNVATKPPVIYLKTLGMSKKYRTMCLSILKKLARSKDCVIFVETEFSEIFDSAVVVHDGNIISMCKEDAATYFKNEMLSVFNINTNKIEASQECKQLYSSTDKTDVAYDYKRLFKPYKTQNIVDLKHKSMPFLARLLTLDFYKINFTQAVILGYMKYEKAFQKQDSRFSIIKSIYPCMAIILVLRMANELRDEALLPHLPSLIAMFINTILDSGSTASMLTFFIENFIIKETSLSRISTLCKSIFRDPFPVHGYRLIFVAVCFSIMYQYSSMFEEDSQALNYSINVLMTPGTYIMSIFTFTVLAHLTTFMLLGIAFNIHLMVINVTCAFFISLLCFGFIGKRMRASFIGVFISTYLFSIFVDKRSKFSTVLLYIFYTIFPSLFYVKEFAAKDSLYTTPFIFSLCHLFFYGLLIYVLICISLSHN